MFELKKLILALTLTLTLLFENIFELLKIALIVLFYYDEKGEQKTTHAIYGNGPGTARGGVRKKSTCPQPRGGGGAKTGLV